MSQAKRSSTNLRCKAGHPHKSELTKECAMSWMSFILNDYRETCEAADAPEWDDEAELDRLRDLDAASLPPYGTPDWFARDFACDCYDFEEAAASAIADAFGQGFPVE